MKRQVFELIRQTNILRQGQDFEVLDEIYTRLGEFLALMRQLRKTRLSKLQLILEDKNDLLVKIQLLEKSKRTILEKIVLQHLQTTLETHFEEMDIPFEIVLKASQIYAETEMQKAQRDSAQRRKRHSKPQNENNEDNEANEQEDSRREFSLFGISMRKNGWVVFAVCLNVLVIILGLKFGGHLLNAVRG
jgi:hypothetical protein